MSIERIVRPFTIGDISPSSTNINYSRSGGGISIVTFGAKGSVKTVTLTQSGSSSYYVVKKPYERVFSVTPGTFKPSGSFKPGGPW